MQLVKLVVIFLILFFTTPIYAATNKFIIDPNHSYILWHINHLGFSTQTGKWYVHGTLELDKEKPANSKVNAEVNIADLVTGILELNKHLQGKLFFDSAQFPVSTFVSDKVDVTGKDTAKVHGILTIHGISKPVILNVKLNKVGMSVVTNKMTAGFSGNTKIKRSDFGINTFLPDLGDEVRIDMEVEAYLADTGTKNAN